MGITLRAFADDIGAIVPTLATLPLIFDIFSSFARMSGLRLNLPKTWFVPLWATTVASVRKMLKDDYPFMASVGVAFI